MPIPQLTARVVDASGVIKDTLFGLGSVTWNPDDFVAAGDGALSNGDLTMAASAGVDQVRATAAITGKAYFEIVATTRTASDQVGPCTRTSLGSYPAFLGQNYPDDWQWAPDGTTFPNIGTAEAWASGANLSFAFDMGANKVWLRVSGGNWNNSATADPATATEGFTFTAPSQAIYPCVFTGSNATSYTAKFSAASWTYAAPSGFSAL